MKNLIKMQYSEIIKKNDAVTNFDTQSNLGKKMVSNKKNFKKPSDPGLFLWHLEKKLIMNDHLESSAAVKIVITNLKKK